MEETIERIKMKPGIEGYVLVCLFLFVYASA